jgi:hypothetical protein
VMLMLMTLRPRRRRVDEAGPGTRTPRILNARGNARWTGDTGQWGHGSWAA